jgi:signal transduction histidine kinase
METMNKGKHGLVLVVDDDPDVLEATSLMLGEFGYTVVPSSSAGDAIKKLATDSSIDVVVTDIVMPEVSGINLLEKVHHINPKTPVILMTAYADMENVIDALKKGAFDFIIKPFSLELLVHSVEKAVKFNRMTQREKEYKHLLEEFNQEIESIVAERTMSLMALTLADKIRNPAAVIGLTCNRIMEKEEVPEKLKPKLQSIKDEAGKLNNIVEHFQSLLKSKRTMFKYEDINGVIESIIPIIRNTAANKGVELVFKPSENTLQINVQKNLFQIALSHLIKNSIEATPEGGKITISTYENSENINLSISDTGYGINEEDLDKIFNPMFSTKENGLGMGLPLVKRIVTEHMGKIDVRSQTGQGTEFIIMFPLRWTEKSLF